MGIFQHHTVIATTWYYECADKFQEWIDSELNDRERQLIVKAGSWVNGYHTFVLVPDGSKEGWEDSNEGDSLRDRMVWRLVFDNYKDDCGSPWDWVECTFGKWGQEISKGNCLK